eukprot:TRINITY_DN25920_c0_g1_i1.p1 TRINITY_DN25920_c0_g1~~TRINITY_DN25920_c0_g1_i1.p1  ORF type:complete len:529 (-),score=153.36 TRINITY_DN25920_c0_g1_i1:188-1774(-)
MATSSAAASAMDPTEEPPAKRARHQEEAVETPVPAAEVSAALPAEQQQEEVPGSGGSGDIDLDGEFDALLGGEAPLAAPSEAGAAVSSAGGDEELLMQQLLEPPPPAPPEEQARRKFAERLSRMERLDEEALPEMLKELQEVASSWGSIRRMRSVALLLVYVSRSSRVCRAAFVAEGLGLLGELLGDSVTALEAGSATERQEAGMRCLACLACLAALPIGRSTMWEQRLTLGKPFDRLHRWCGREKSALAAELRAPTQALCRRWRQQPKPALQDGSPEKKALRVKVLEIIKQGLQGIAGCSPASPGPGPGMLSPGLGMPSATVAAEVETALFGLHGGATAEYRQHARMLRNNLALAGNAFLRNRILAGEISAKELAEMDSRSLAPESLQEKRRVAELETLRSVVAKSPTPEKSHMDWRDATYDPSTGASREDLEAASQEQQQQPKGSSSSDGGMPAPAPLLRAANPTATPLPMEPPPTPFTDGHPATPLRQGMAADHQVMPEVMATPAPEEEDEQGTELIRWFSQTVM